MSQPPTNPSHNPYASPNDPIPAEPVYTPQPQQGVQMVSRDGNLLVVAHQATLPKVCVKTGQAATKTVKRTFHWHHPAIYLTILAGVLIYVVLAIILRKTMVVEIPLSDQAFSRRRRNLNIIIGLMLACVGVIVFGFYAVSQGNVNDDTWIAIGIFSIIGGFLSLLILAVIQTRVAAILKPKKIDDYFAWLAGVNQDFLSKLPPIQGNQ